MGFCSSKNQKNNDIPIQSERQNDKKYLAQTQEVCQSDFKPNQEPITLDYLLHQKYLPNGVQFDVIHRQTSKKYTVGIVEKSVHDTLNIKFVEEFKIQASVHPNIQRYHELYETSSNYQVVKESVKGLTFLQYIQLSKPSHSKLREIIQSVMSALNQLHMKGIAHTDIRDETIIFENSNQDSNFKIITIQEIKKTTTDHFRSPETLKNKSTIKSDIWSMGVLLYLGILGELPFDGKDQEQVRNAIQRGVINYNDHLFDSISQDLIDLLKKMLAYNPAKRPTLQGCLQDPWFFSNPKKLSKIQIQAITDMSRKMSSFNCRSKIQQATMLMIIEESQQDKQTREILNIFKKFDQDHSGTLSKQELLLGFSQIMDPEQAQQNVDQILKDFDIDGSGCVDYNEFLLSLCLKQRDLKEEKILAIFNQFDTNKTGSLSLSEIKKLLLRMNLTESEILQAIKEFDKDGNGEISKVEFIEGMITIYTKPSQEQQDQPILSPKAIKSTPKTPKSSKSNHRLSFQQ